MSISLNTKHPWWRQGRRQSPLLAHGFNDIEEVHADPLPLSIAKSIARFGSIEVEDLVRDDFNNGDLRRTAYA